jgi:PAS domain-containing protein
MLESSMATRNMAPRLYAILARDKPVAAVFRRGPSKQVLLLTWNTATHEITPGQWFKGRIYERRCDLSPSGERWRFRISTDVEGRISYMNSVAERLTGWPLKEALGCPLEEVFKIIDAETRTTILNPMAKATEKNATVGLPPTCTLIRRNGEESANACWDWHLPDIQRLNRERPTCTYEIHNPPLKDHASVLPRIVLTDMLA